MTTTHDNAQTQIPHDAPAGVPAADDLAPTMPPFSLHQSAPVDPAPAHGNDLSWIKRFTPDPERVPGAELRERTTDPSKPLWIAGGVLAAVAIVGGIATSGEAPQGQQFVKATNAGDATLKLGTGVDPVLIHVDAKDGIVTAVKIECAAELGKPMSTCPAPPKYTNLVTQWKVGTAISTKMCGQVAEIDLQRCQRQSGSY